MLDIIKEQVKLYYDNISKDSTDVQNAAQTILSMQALTIGFKWTYEDTIALIKYIDELTAVKVVETTEEGYAIKVTGYQLNGDLYKEGFVGDWFYVSRYEAALWKDKEEAIESLNSYSKELNDGTVKFKLCKIKRSCTVTEEEEEAL
jgi:hypothetical protein